jgi:hypothetical protein
MGKGRKKNMTRKLSIHIMSTKPRINLVTTSNRREALTHTYKCGTTTT